MPGDEAPVLTTDFRSGWRPRSGERDMGPSLFEELLLLPQPYDTRGAS